MSFAKDQDVIQAVVPKRPDEAFNIGDFRQGDLGEIGRLDLLARSEGSNAAPPSDLKSLALRPASAQKSICTTHDEGDTRALSSSPKLKPIRPRSGQWNWVSPSPALMAPQRA